MANSLTTICSQFADRSIHTLDH